MDGDAIRSGGQLARFTPKWTASSPGHNLSVGGSTGCGHQTRLRCSSLRPPKVNRIFSNPSRTGSGRVSLFLCPANPVSLSPVCCASSRWPPSSPHNRFVPSEPVYPRPDLQSRQPYDTCPPPHAPCLSRLTRHSRGVHPYSHAAKSQTLSRFFLPRPTVFFHALPFGLNVAPFIFTQVLAWPIQCLRDRGISLLAYLDDIVIWHRDRDTLLAQVHHVMWFLQDMGFRLSMTKSLPYPTDSTIWFGVRWFPQMGHWQLLSEGQLNIGTLALDLLHAPWVTRLQLERLVGVINFICQVHRFLRPFL